jgi:DNA-directed RNA polymerase subunit RPC12/RpoP
MAKKTVGYIELEWTCKSCGTKNPGTQKTCTNCGAAMSVEDQFELPAEQKLINDQEKLAQAEKGADIHCPYCGARNTAGAQACAQCGGDLKGAQARQAGTVMGAYSDQAAPPVRCPACSSPNPAGAPRCQNCGASLTSPGKPPAPPAAPKTSPPNKGLLIAGIAAVVLVCLGALALIMLALRTEEQTATVQSVQWERSIAITEQRPVESADWKDQIPAGAEMGACEERLRSTQPEPAPGAEEVCGTPYTVDKGSGMAEVVQDCEYQIYADWCTFSQMDWVVVDSVSAQGNDLNPAWPLLALSPGQQEGERSEQYVVVFVSSGEDYTYTTGDPVEFNQFTPGSEWILQVNTFGGVTGVEEK